MRVMGEDEWRSHADNHAQRIDRLLGDAAARRRSGVKHPVQDFLLDYYPYRMSRLRQWHPGYGVELRGDVQQWLQLRGYVQTDNGVTVGTEILDRLSPQIAAIRELNERVASRPAVLGCFGLHEWAMVYRQAADRRHQGWPLRLGPEGTDAVVRTLPIRCSHYDAFRFFTPPARPLNKQNPDLAGRLANEQPGCVHVTMDLYKWAMKSAPWVPAELAADCFELARDARSVDMRASPYDFSAVGLAPIRIETPEGRGEYEQEQRRLTKKAEPLRARLVAALNDALGASAP
jgi:hypothetical protein